MSSPAQEIWFVAFTQRMATCHKLVDQIERITDTLFGTEPHNEEKTPKIGAVVGAHADDLANLERRLEHQVARLNSLVRSDGDRAFPEPTRR